MPPLLITLTRRPDKNQMQSASIAWMEAAPIGHPAAEEKALRVWEEQNCASTTELKNPFGMVSHIRYSGENTPHANKVCFHLMAHTSTISCLTFSKWKSGLHPRVQSFNLLESVGTCGRVAVPQWKSYSTRNGAHKTGQSKLAVQQEAQHDFEKRHFLSSATQTNYVWQVKGPCHRSHHKRKASPKAQQRLHPVSDRGFEGRLANSHGQYWII